MERMRLAIVAAAKGAGASDAFQTAARELVSDGRRREVPPEQICCASRRSDPRRTSPSDAAPAEPPAPVGAQTEIYRDVIAWTIRHYFEGEAPA